MRNASRKGPGSPPGVLSVATVLRRAVRAHALGGRAASVGEAVRRAAGIYSAAPTCHLASALRVRSYSTADLDREVLRTRSLVRVHAMRGSVYLVPREWVPHALALTKIRAAALYAKLARISEKALARLGDRIERIVGEKPRTAAEIRVELGKAAPPGTGLTLAVGYLGREGRIVRTAVRGGERSQSYEYARMAEWVDLPDERPSRDEALRTLAMPWLLANGPATAADLAWWAGVGLREAKAALAAFGAKPVSVNGLDGELLATEELLEDFATPLASEDEVHLLPYWDSYVMAHANRRRYLADARRPLAIDRMGNVTNLVIRGGRVVGLWDVDGARLLFAPFERFPRRAVEDAASRLAPLGEIDAVEEVAVPGPLAARGQNAFLAPLRPRRASATRIRGAGAGRS